MRFWDSSALVALVAEQSAAPTTRPLAQEDPEMALWWGTRVEVASGLSRLRREGILRDDALSRLLQEAQESYEHAGEIEPSESLREEAVRLVKTHDLRAGDAFQLAAALAWADHKPSGLGFVCLDKRLREAALKEGFTVLPE